MNSLQRFSAIAALSLLCSLFGCSGGTTTTAAPVVPPTTPSPPTTSTPVITAKAKFAYTANEGASLSGYSVNPSTGALTALPGFPLSVGANPYMIVHDPQNRFLLVDDNSVFQLHVYAIDATTGALTEVKPSPYETKIQPGRMIVDPSGTHVYFFRAGASVRYPGVTGNQVVAYNLSATGVLTEVAGSPFYTGSTAPTSSTGIATDAAGKFLYLQDITNIYTFSIDSGTGALTLVQTLASGYGGGLAIDPAGAYLYASGSNNILTYQIDPVAGTLKLARSSPAKLSSAYNMAISPTGTSAYTIESNNYLVSYSIADGAFTSVGTPRSGIYGLNLTVDPSGSFLYVPQGCINCPSGVYDVVHEFSIDTTGSVTPLSNATVAGGKTPYSITVTSQ